MLEELNAQEKVGTGEVPFDGVLSSFLTNEKLQDVSLISRKDGTTINTNRYVLASRSTYFEKSLLGSFMEAKTFPLAIHVDYNGAVLTALMEYIHYGKTESLIENDDDKLYNVVRISNLLELAAAALYYNLPRLCRWVYQWFYKTLRKSPSLAFAMLEACNESDVSSSCKDFEALAKTFLRADVEGLLVPSAVSTVSDTVLESIVKDEKSQLKEAQLLELLQIWSTCERNKDSSAASGVAPSAAKRARISQDASSSSDRLDVALGLVKHIRLECVPTNVLEDLAKCSGLISHEQLFETFRKKASMAEADNAICFDQSRAALPRWTKSRAHRFKYLNAVQMESGVHRWIIELKRADLACTWVGIAANIGLFVDERHKDLFCFDGRGTAYWGPKKSSTTAPKFSKSSRLTFELNLLPERPEKGSLSVAVDSGAVVTLFQNLLSVRHKCKQKAQSRGFPFGFVPVVSVGYKPKAAAVLLSIEQIEAE